MLGSALLWDDCGFAEGEGSKRLKSNSQSLHTSGTKRLKSVALLAPKTRARLLGSIILFYCSSF